MTRLEKELKKRGIVFTEDEYMESTNYNNPECSASLLLVDVQNGLIVTVFHSAVLDSEIRIYDRNYHMVGGQDLFPDQSLNFFGGVRPNPWHSFGWKEVA